MKKQKGALRKWLYWLFLAIVIIIFYKILDSYNYVSQWLGNLFNVLMPFFVGILIAYVLYIPCRTVERLFQKSKNNLIRKKSKALGILIVYALLLLIISLAIKFLIPIIAQSILDLVNNFQGYYASLNNKINELPEDSFLRGGLLDNIIANIQNIDLKEYINIQNIGSYLKSVLNAATGIFDIFISIIVSIYVLLERNKIVKGIEKLIDAMLDKKLSKKVIDYFSRTNEILLKFIASQVLDGIVVGILTTIAMKILNVKYGVSLGILIGVSNLIPYFGAIIGVSIAIIITIFTGGFAQAIWMGIIIIILQQIDANIINPKIVGNSLKISPLLVILAVTIGGAYFGTLGMFLAVPVVVVMKILIEDFVEYRLKLRSETKTVNIDREE